MARHVTLVTRVLPARIADLGEPLYRPVSIAYVAALLSAVLMTLVMVLSIINVRPEDDPMVLEAGAIILGVELALAWAAVGLLAFGFFAGGRFLLMLFATLVMMTVSLVLGRDTGVDLVGTTALVALPALIYAWDERGQMLLAGLLATAGIVAMVWGYTSGLSPLIPVPEWEMLLNRIFAVVVSGIVGGFIIYLHHSAEVAKIALAAEKERSEALLLNILPEATADRLKSGERLIADSCERVTVLFADLVGFTSFSATQSAESVVGMLNRLFSGFDDIAAVCGVEKIKTIGDGYMAAGGIPLTRPDHARIVALMAIGMIELVERLQRSEGLQIGVRIGIHTGPAVAGVIGKRKFTYDLWGDTVNTASRMESHGAPMRINVSAAAYAHLAEDFAFEARGAIQVKGKGEMECYFLKGPKQGR